MLLVVEVPPRLSPLWFVMEKIIQIDILVFLEAKEMNLRGNLGTFLCFTNKFLIFLL